MSLFGLGPDLAGLDIPDLAQRAVTALENMATALDRQATVMEGDVTADPAVEQVWVRRYGETLSRIMDSEDLNLFEKNKNLRNLATTMTKHGEETETQAR